MITCPYCGFESEDGITHQHSCPVLDMPESFNEYILQGDNGSMHFWYNEMMWNFDHPDYRQQLIDNAPKMENIFTINPVTGDYEYAQQTA
jgi:hypothetical protein